MSDPLERRARPFVVASGLALLVAALLGSGLLLSRQPRTSPPVAAEATLGPGQQADQPAGLGTPDTPTAASAQLVTRAAPTPAPPEPGGPAPVEAAAPAGIDPRDPALSGTPIEISFVEVRGTVVVLGAGTPTPVAAWWAHTEDSPEPYRKAVEDAYVAFWSVRTHALAQLDEQLISTVMAGPPLEAELQAMRRLRAAGEVQLVDVEHHASVLWATADEGAVLDAYVNRTATVDAGAPEPTPVEPTTWRVAYRLQRLETGWRIVEAIRVGT